MTVDNTVHQGQPILTAGAPLDQAKAVMVMVHGRGASARDILSLSAEFARDDVAYIAPQAYGNTWYPQSFLMPLGDNEPYLTSALQAVGDVVQQVETAGIPAEKIIILGFSQGACLSTEFAARNAKRYGGVVALSGGLIGAEDTPRDYAGSLEDTPVFLGCSDVDFHIPLQRVHDSKTWLEALGGDVTERIYPQMGHTINEDELEFVRDLVKQVAEK
ncbi:MAG: dienelactone hydrolase family protein [Aggregatilineales bacterium]